MSLVSLRFVRLLPLFFALCCGITVDGYADPGNFWYGPYRTFSNGAWGESVYSKLRGEFKMNWALAHVNDQRAMDSAVAAAGWP